MFDATGVRPLIIGATVALSILCFVPANAVARSDEQSPDGEGRSWFRGDASSAPRHRGGLFSRGSSQEPRSRGWDSRDEDDGPSRRAPMRRRERDEDGPRFDSRRGSVRWEDESGPGEGSSRFASRRERSPEGEGPSRGYRFGRQGSRGGPDEGRSSMGDRRGPGSDRGMRGGGADSCPECARGGHGGGGEGRGMGGRGRPSDRSPYGGSRSSYDRRGSMSARADYPRY